jgi:uncharacterized protein involved in outer membrane biogenesis
MTNGAESKKKLRGRLRMALAVLAVLVLALVVPPLISVSHYKGQITRLIAQSLGRPVRLSSVEVRLLPRPGFVLYDLSVAEDPAYGAEPVLHANKVTASLRLLALWRGRVEIDKISVDEASLNLVRAGPGRWNLDPIFRTAAAETGVAMSGTGGASINGSGDASSRRAQRLPSLEATDSRINFKNGAEKLPFSLLNADISLWQASPGEWRIQLRGQPARTDVSLYQEETGVVRMEASVRSAPALRQMPVHLDLNWREARLGQLARLIAGSDPGWRGDLTGDLHIDGTADAAQIAMRLRASGLHRAEFAPTAPFDFDANCGFVYHYTRRSLENLACDSPLGDGRMKLSGEKLGLDTPPQFTVELDRIPVAAGLVALRALRNSLDPSIEASGTVSGKIVYASGSGSAAQPVESANKPTKSKPGLKAVAEPTGPLTGSLTVTDFALSGGGLSRPVQASKITLEPSAAPRAQATALTGTVAIAAGGDTPLVYNLRLSLAGYQVGVRGQAAIARARELAHAAGIPQSRALSALAGDPITVDLTAAGPWMPPEVNPLAVTAGTESVSAVTQESPAPPLSTGADVIPSTDSLTGTVTLRNANWKADFLASHVEIAEATLHLDGSSLRWEPVAFSYGPLKGTLSLSVPLDVSLPCPSDLPAPQPCPAQFQIQFGDLDAGTLESALLGAQEKSTLLSDLINRLRPSASPPWPALEGTVKADSLVLGPVTLHGVSAALRVLPASVEISNLDAGLLGGSLHVAGSLLKPATDQDKPDYTFEGGFQKIDATSLGALLGLRWTGAPLNGNGKIELAGYTAKDLAASAHGALHFEARRGAIGNQPSESSKAGPVPAALGRFDRWTADANFANGSLTLDQNVVTAGARKQSVQATVTFGDPPVVSFAAPKQAAAKPR